MWDKIMDWPLGPRWTALNGVIAGVCFVGACKLIVYFGS